MRKKQLVVVSMLVAMKTDDGLRRDAITFITKKFGVAHCTVYHLWERAKSMHELGTINSLEFILSKEHSRRGVMYPNEFVQESVKHMWFFLSEVWWEVGCSHHMKCIATLI